MAYLVAHRGFRIPDKENRMVDFEKALLTCQAVEFDIRLTKDKKVIIFHDHSFKRIGKIYFSVKQLAYNAIKTLPFFFQNPEYTPPLLTDFADKLSSQYKMINVEIKPCYYNEKDYQVILEALNYLRSKTNAEIIVSSFGFNDLKFISNLDGNLFKKGYLTENLSQINEELLEKFDYLHPYVGTVNNLRNVNAIIALNKPMNIWTYKNNLQAKITNKLYPKRLINSFISDNPNLIID